MPMVTAIIGPDDMTPGREISTVLKRTGKEVMFPHTLSLSLRGEYDTKWSHIYLRFMRVSQVSSLLVGELHQFFQAMERIPRVDGLGG